MLKNNSNKITIKKNTMTAFCKDIILLLLISTYI